MSKELKAPDKVTQKMTRDGAVAENLTTGETSSISERPQEENYLAPAGVAAGRMGFRLRRVKGFFLRAFCCVSLNLCADMLHNLFRCHPCGG